MYAALQVGPVLWRLGIGLEEQWQGKVRGKSFSEEPSLADLRFKLASNVGFAARRLWRRTDLEDFDEVILDLLCEALQRIGHNYRSTNASYRIIPYSGASADFGRRRITWPTGCREARSKAIYEGRSKRSARSRTIYKHRSTRSSEIYTTIRKILSCVT